MSRQRSTALHEAGHAVAAHYRPLSGATVRLTIAREDLAAHNARKTRANEAAGLHFPASTLPIIVRGRVVDPEALEHKLVVLLAGKAAEFIAEGEPPKATKRQQARAIKASGEWDGSDDETRAFKLLVAAERPDLGEELKRAKAALNAGVSADEIARRLRAEDRFSPAVWERFERARREAHDLVVEKWAHVVAVADRLIAKKRLSGDEVREIIEAVEERLRSGPPRFGFTGEDEK